MEKRIKILDCCCCGGAAPAYEQWWNRDNGYGVCKRCFDEDFKKYGEQYARDCYGVAGVHHSIEVSNDK